MFTYQLSVRIDANERFFTLSLTLPSPTKRDDTTYRQSIWAPIQVVCSIVERHNVDLLMVGAKNDDTSINASTVYNHNSERGLEQTACGKRLHGSLQVQSNIQSMVQFRVKALQFPAFLT